MSVRLIKGWQIILMEGLKESNNGLKRGRKRAKECEGASNKRGSVFGFRGAPGGGEIRQRRRDLQEMKRTWGL